MRKPHLREVMIESLINDNADYSLIIEVIARVPLAGEQEHYMNLLKKKRRMSKESIKRDIQNYLKNNKEIIAEHREELPEDEKNEALTLLQNENFWEKFLETTEQLGYVGEEGNKIALYLVMTSRKLDDPINTIIKGESSAGKSFLVGGISSFFPEEDMRVFTAITPKALYHRKDSLQNKVLIIYERHGAEESDYSLRTLQSEKKLILSTTVKNSLTGSFETQDIEVEGPVSYIETTTRSHIHPENETRCFDLFIDESERQTKKIHEAQNKKHAIETLDKGAILRPWRNAQRLLRAYPIYIPYIDAIKFPTRPLRVRRDKPKFLALIEAHALLSQYRRNIQIIGGKEFITADIEDYVMAYSLAEKILESVLKGLSPRVKAVIEIAASFNNREFTRKDLEKKVDWNWKTLEKYIGEAVNWGYFEITQEGGKGKPYEYKLIRTEAKPIGLLTPEELAEEMANPKKVKRLKPILEMPEDEISKITSNHQMGGGDFKPFICNGLSLNHQYHQEE